MLPTTATVTAAAAELTPRTPPDQRLTLVFAPGVNSYPLINYEYAVVSNQAVEPAGCFGHQQFPALVHSAARRQRARLS